MFDSGLDTEHAFGHHAAMSRTRVRRRRTTLAVAAALLSGVVLGPVGHVFAADAAPRRPRTVVVRPGDTLWSLAERTDPGEDPRVASDAIAAANDLEAGSLVPGQRLVLPAP
jgi:nucleoid-associated protein YgaU